MNDEAKKAKRRLTGTRAKQKRVPVLAVLSALFSIMGGSSPGYHAARVPVGAARVPVGAARRASESADSVAARVERSAAKQERKRGARFLRHSRSVANSYRGEWLPKPSSMQKFEWQRDYRGALVPPRWAHQSRYMSIWSRIVQECSNVK